MFLNVLSWPPDGRRHWTKVVGQLRSLAIYCSSPQTSKRFHRVTIFQNGRYSRSNTRTTNVTKLQSFIHVYIFVLGASCAVVYQLAVRHFFPFLPKRIHLKGTGFLFCLFLVAFLFPCNLRVDCSANSHQHHDILFQQTIMETISFNLQLQNTA